MNQPATAVPTKCTRCGKPADPVVYKTIIDRAYDPVRGKQYVRQQNLPFCSEEHASHHQMSCEGYIANLHKELVQFNLELNRMVDEVADKARAQTHRLGA